MQFSFSEVSSHYLYKYFIYKSLKMIILLVLGCDEATWEKLGKEYDECVIKWHFGLMQNDGWSDEFCEYVFSIASFHPISCVNPT